MALTRRQLRRLFLGASLNESTARGAGAVSPMIGAIEAMALANKRRQEQQLQQRAHESQQQSLLPGQGRFGLPSAVRTSGGGGDGKSIGGFLGNLLGDKGLWGAFRGLPQGVYELGKATVHDIGEGNTLTGINGVPIPNIFSGKSEVNKNVIKPVGKAYSDLYGPLLPGGKESFNFGKFWNRVYEAPLQPILDIAAIPSLGGTAAVKGAGLARTLGARGPVTDALIKLGDVEGRASVPLAALDKEGVTAPEIMRRYSPSMNRRLFQRFVGDPASKRLGDAFPGWQRFATGRELGKLARQQSSLRNITEQHAVEASVQDVMPALQEGTVVEKLMDRIPGVKGHSGGLSKEEQVALSLRKRGITSQPLKTRNEARVILALKETDPVSYTRAIADGADVDWNGLRILQGRREKGILTPKQEEHLNEAESEMHNAEARLHENANAPEDLLGRAQASWRAGLEGLHHEGANFEDFPGVPREYVESLINLSPRVKELIERPTPAMLEASRAWDHAVEAQRQELGISPEEHRRRVWATQSSLRSGVPIDQLEREFDQWAAAQGGVSADIRPNYMPDIPAENLEMRRGKLRDVQNVRTSDPAARAAVERAFVPPRFAYLEDTDLMAFKAGVFRTDTNVLLTHLAKVARDLNAKFYNAEEIARVGMRGPDGELLLIAAKDLDKVVGQSPMQRDWTWVPQDVTVKWFNQEINVLERAIEVIRDNVKLDDDSVLAQLNGLMETDARMFEQELMGATKTDGFVVPRQWSEKMTKLQELQDWRPEGAVGAYMTFLNKWRALTLAYMPRWWVNTAVGSFVLNMLKGVWDPRAYIQAARLMSRGKVPPGIALGGGVIRAELHGGAATGRELFPTRQVFKTVQKIEDFFRTASGLHSLDRLEKQSLREMEGSMRNFARPMTGLADDEYVQHLLSNPRRVEAAMDEVNRFSYNFMQLGYIERKYIRNFGAPFWGWYKFVTKLVWSLPMDYPGRMLVIQKLGQVGAESEKDLGPFMPIWMKGAIIWNKQDPEHLKYMSTFGINPFSQFANPFSDAGFVQGMFAPSQLAPPVQAAIAGAGIDPMTSSPVPIAPDAGVGRDFFGGFWRGNEQLPNLGAVRAPERILGGLLRSFPQARTLELFNTKGRPVYPESIPFVSEHPMDVRPETIRSPGQLGLQQFGLNIRPMNLEARSELGQKQADYASKAAERAAKDYLEFLKKYYQ